MITSDYGIEELDLEELDDDPYVITNFIGFLELDEGKFSIGEYNELLTS